MEATHRSEPVTLGQFVASKLGRPDAVAADHDVVLGPVTLVADFESLDAAREGIRRVEGLAKDDEQIGFVTIGGHDVQRSQGGVDPENIAGKTMRSAVPGAVIGAIFGLVVIGLIGWAVAGSTTGLIAGAIAGALFFGAVGGMVSAFARLGASDAYQDAFVASEPKRVVVGVQLREAEQVEAAMSALAQAGGTSVGAVDEFGRPLRAGPAASATT
jgi:hypothetical protein